MNLLADDIVSAEKLSAEIILEKGYSKVLICEEGDFLYSLLKDECTLEKEEDATSPEIVVAYGGDKTLSRAKALSQSFAIPATLIPSSMCMSAAIPYYYDEGPRSVLLSRSLRIVLVDDILSASRESIKDGFAVAAALLMEAFDLAFEDKLFDRDVESSEKLATFERVAKSLSSIKSFDKTTYKIIKKALLDLVSLRSTNENLAYKLYDLSAREGKSDLFSCAYALFAAYINYERKDIFFTVDRVKVLERSKEVYSSPYSYAEPIDVEDFSRKNFVVDLYLAELKKSLSSFEKLSSCYRRLYGSGGYELRNLSLKKILFFLPIVAEAAEGEPLLKTVYLNGYLDPFLLDIFPVI